MAVKRYCTIQPKLGNKLPESWKQGAVTNDLELDLWEVAPH